MLSEVKYHDVFTQYNTEFDPNINVELLDKDLWDDLFSVTNEMYATPTGRGMLPQLKLKFTGLNPVELYAVCIEFEQLTSNRWRYVNGQWVADGQIACPENMPGFMHCRSFQNGKCWMLSDVTFEDIRLATSEIAVDASNTRRKGNIVFLESQAKYVPILKIFKLGLTFALAFITRLEECQFILVTSYKNPKMLEKKGNTTVTSLGSIQSQVRRIMPHMFPHENSVRSITTFAPTELRKQNMRKLTQSTTTRLFPEQKMNFFTFVELYKIRNTQNEHKYSLGDFVTEIKNNNLNLPKFNLGLPEEFKALQARANNPESSTSGAEESEGAVGGCSEIELTENHYSILDDVQTKMPGHYIVDSAYPLEEFLTAYMRLEDFLPPLSDQVLQELRCSALNEDAK